MNAIVESLSSLNDALCRDALASKITSTSHVVGHSSVEVLSVVGNCVVDDFVIKPVFCSVVVFL